MMTRRHDPDRLRVRAFGPGLAKRETILRILLLRPLPGLELRTACIHGAAGREPAHLSRTANV